MQTDNEIHRYWIEYLVIDGNKKTALLKARNEAAARAMVENSPECDHVLQIKKLKTAKSE